jgi:phosphoribosylaminoimidazole-succinocarboxamide synthase
MAQVKFDLKQYLPLVATGKVRELYEVDSKTLLFVATDRISAYDVIMKNVGGLSFQSLGDADYKIGCPPKGSRSNTCQQVLA